MDPALRAFVQERLRRDLPDSRESALVLAACDGHEALAALLERGTLPSPSGDEAAQREAAHAYLLSITVEGFRGIGPASTLTVVPGPGLTLVIGRNGSGKSSFAEGLELLLTGESSRWANRSQIWREGWRNLHHPVARIEAEFAIEGARGATRISRAWRDGAGLNEGVVSVQSVGQPRSNLDALRWETPLAKYRPFLSYSELGSLLDEGPSKLFDAVSAILGLEDLVAAEKTLQAARLERERRFKAAAQELDAILATLRQLDDLRAQRCTAALAGRSWQLDELEAVLGEGAGSAGADTEVELLRRIAALESPRLAAVPGHAARLRAAMSRQRTLAGAEAGRLLAVARLLESALAFHEQHGDADCPVCGNAGALEATWVEAARERVQTLSAEAAAVAAAGGEVRTAMQEARGLLTSPPEILDACGRLGLDGSSARVAWEQWAAGRSIEAPDEFATHLEEHAGPLAAAVEALRAAATDEVRRRDDLWRPVALTLARWLESARAAEQANEQARSLKRAEDWLKKASAALRNKRFAPIADEAIDIWRLLRQRSNVELGRVELDGLGTRRRVVLDVTVDGTGGAALAVMSQGELNALALSLFLPRASLHESPFGFVVIDDPVQAMDPAKVDGLARVLERTARRRQLLVFTHDDRLPEAVRRLDVPATIIEVTRRERSGVELRPALSPVERYLDDARALCRTQELPPVVAGRVVPGFCRSAIEAACAAVVRRRRLARGEGHADVEQLLTSSGKLTVLASLALFDEPLRGGDVLGRLNRQYGPQAGNAFQAVNRGAHAGYEGDLKELVRATSILCQKLLDLK